MIIGGGSIRRNSNGCLRWASSRAGAASVAKVLGLRVLGDDRVRVARRGLLGLPCASANKPACVEAAVAAHPCAVGVPENVEGLPLRQRCWSFSIRGLDIARSRTN
jgi:hypothetical protein